MGTASVRCACIDIGSNTTRLLVAEPANGGLRELLAQRAYTRLGKGLDPGGEISSAKIAEVAEVVATQTRLADELGIDALRAVGTAAIRAAANRDALLVAVRERSGVSVDILSDDDEGRLAFAGAVRTLGQRLAGVIGIADVGGGSTELAVGTRDGGVSWVTSLPVGSGRLTDAHVTGDPPGTAELDALRERVAAAFAGLAVPAVDEAVAVGGTATALRRLVGTLLEPETLERAVRVLAGTPVTAVAERFQIDPERVRLLPAGIFLLEEASVRFGRPLRIGKGGLREGVVLDLAHRAGASARA